MLKQGFLSLLLVTFIPVTLQARLQENLRPADLRILVEGEPSAARAIIEAMRRSSTPDAFSVQFVSRSADQHDIRLIVIAEKGNVWCFNSANLSNTSSAGFFYSTVIALTPGGGMLFAVAQSSGASKQTVDAVATDVTRKLFTYSRSLKEKAQSGSNVLRDQGTAESGKVLSQSLPAEPGVYQKDNTGWIRLTEGFAQGVKTGGMGTALLTWGVSKMRVAQLYSGAQATVQFSERKPTFYVRGFAVTEHEVQVARLEKKKDHRQIQIASIGAFSSESGYKGRDIFKAKIARIAEDIYTITPASELEPGEYILSLSNGGFEGVYEFGVTPTKK